MSSDDNAIWDEIEYSVISVDKTTPPEGVSGGSWYRYVVGRGKSTLVGCRTGTRAEVTSHAEALASDLNSRSGRSGRSIWATTHRK
jgi:hypothetical protein